jgi:hypothetical protein
MNRLALGIQLADDRVVLDTDRQLGDLVSPGHPAVQAFVAAAMRARIEHRWSPTCAAGPFAKSIGSRLGEAGRKIADAFV